MYDANQLNGQRSTNASVHAQGNSMPPGWVPPPGSHYVRGRTEWYSNITPFSSAYGFIAHQNQQIQALQAQQQAAQRKPAKTPFWHSRMGALAALGIILGCLWAFGILSSAGIV